MALSLTSGNEKIILDLARSGRLPHTVIIEGDSKQERDIAALLLAASAVCTAEEKPCLRCAQCRKILDGQHPDMLVPKPSKKLKSGIISLQELRGEYLSQASVKPNEAQLRIYLFTDADRLLREDSQNTLLKLIEEPPQSILFIFTAEKAKALLPTVRSRARVITLGRVYTPDGESEAAAQAITDGVTNLYEYDLLLTLTKLGKKEEVEAALTAFLEKLRLALCFSSGVMTDDPCSRKLARKLDRGRLTAMLEATSDAVRRLNTNVNLQLLTTQLCSQYRRITWQK